MNSIISSSGSPRLQAAVGDQPLHQVVQRRGAAGHPLDEIDAPLFGEPHAVGHQHAKQLLLPLAH